MEKRYQAGEDCFEGIVVADTLKGLLSRSFQDQIRGRSSRRNVEPNLGIRQAVNMKSRAKPGRPKTGRKPRNVQMLPQVYAWLLRVGNGSASQGLELLWKLRPKL